MEYEVESTELAAAFNAKGYTEITPADVSEWLEGQGIGDADKVDAAAVKLLGANNYNFFNCSARLWHAVGYALEVPGYEQRVGGIDVSVRPEGSFNV